MTRKYHEDVYQQLDELVKQSYKPASDQSEGHTQEQLKDIYFGEILNSALDKNHSINKILEQMVNAINAYFKDEAIISLHQIIRLPRKKFEELLVHEGKGYDNVLHDIDGHPLASFCVIDTSLGEKLTRLSFEQRAFSIDEDSIIGESYNLGEGIVYVDEEILEDENIQKTRVKRIHYKPIEESKWFNLKIQMGFDGVKEYDKKRMVFPVYNYDLKHPDIDYIILIDSKAYKQFSPEQVRAVRGFEIYTASSIKIKKLNEILSEVSKKNKLLSQKDKKLVQTVAIGAHSIKSPLSIMMYTIEGFQQFVNEGRSPDIDQLKSGLLRLTHAQEQIMERVSTLDSAAMKYEMNPYPFDHFVKETCYLDFKEGTTYGQHINFHFDLKAKDKNNNDLEVMMDKVQFRKVLYDMIINTYEKCVEDGKEAVFTVKTRSHGGYVAALLHDNLGGMPEKQFIEFKETEGCKTTKEKGSGIGTKTIKKYFLDINNYHKKNFIKFHPFNQSRKGFGIYIKIPIYYPDDQRYTFFVPI